MSLSRDSRLAALEDSLSEVMIMVELRPALDLVAEMTHSAFADYFRFPRYHTGPLGAAALGLGSEPALIADMHKRPGTAVALQRSMGEAASVLLVTIDGPPFGERGSTGLVLGRARGEPAYAKREQVLLEKCLPAWIAAARRIRKFETVTGQNAGLTTLIEKRLGACAILASAHGEIIWMSQSAREALGDFGREVLEARLRQGTKELIHGASQAGKEFALSLDGKHRLFGAMSFVREGPDTSVHFLAVELHGSDVHSHADEAKLTPSEREIYKLLKLGKSNDEIARARFVSIETVRSHVKTMFRKLGISSRVELLVRKPKGD